MAKRGRPTGRKTVWPGWMLGAQMEAINAYNKARQNGAKHEAAIDETMRTLSMGYPDANRSRGYIKRLLSKYQPEGAALAFVVSEIPQAEVEDAALRMQAAGEEDAIKWKRGLRF